MHPESQLLKSKKAEPSFQSSSFIVPLQSEESSSKDSSHPSSIASPRSKESGSHPHLRVDQIAFAAAEQAAAVAPTWDEQHPASEEAGASSSSGTAAVADSRTVVEPVEPLMVVVAEPWVQVQAAAS